MFTIVYHGLPTVMLHQPKPSELVTFTCAAHPGETAAVSGATFAGTVCSGRSSFCSFHSGISLRYWVVGGWNIHSEIWNIMTVNWKHRAICWMETDIKWHRWPSRLALLPDPWKMLYMENIFITRSNNHRVYLSSKHVEAKSEEDIHFAMLSSPKIHHARKTQRPLSALQSSWALEDEKP